MAIVLLAIILLLGLALGLELVYLSGSASRLPHVLESEESEIEFSNFDKYTRMVRCFSGEDLDSRTSEEHFLEDVPHSPRLSRRKMMMVYLREIRRDFNQAWSLCRLLAPFSKDPQMGSTLFKQAVLFHGLYLALWLQVVMQHQSYVRLDARRLIETLQSLRQSTHQAILAARTQTVEMS